VSFSSDTERLTEGWQDLNDGDVDLDDNLDYLNEAWAKLAANIDELNEGYTDLLDDDDDCRMWVLPNSGTNLHNNIDDDGDAYLDHLSSVAVMDSDLGNDGYGDFDLDDDSLNDLMAVAFASQQNNILFDVDSELDKNRVEVVVAMTGLPMEAAFQGLDLNRVVAQRTGLERSIVQATEGDPSVIDGFGRSKEPERDKKNEEGEDALGDFL